MHRKIEPGHGFWIISEHIYKKGQQIAYCSACGMPNIDPIGNYCRWCGTHMDQVSLNLTSKPYHSHIVGECAD